MEIKWNDSFSLGMESGSFSKESSIIDNRFHCDLYVQKPPYGPSFYMRVIFGLLAVKTLMFKSNRKVK